MLRFNKVSFAYGPDNDPVLKDIDLEIGDGESVVFMGSNGSGKTTLALLAAGLLKPSSGTIERDSPDDPAGVVFQNPDNQIVSVTVENELAFPLECRQIESEQIRMHVDDALTHYGFTDRERASPNNLSGGEKQKLALASALICKPSLLVLDEPTSHLDASGRKTLEDAVESVRRDNPEMSVLTITQSSSDALKYDRLVLMNDGRIAADNDPERIFANSDLCRSCGIDIPDEMLLKWLNRSALSSSPANPVQEPVQTEIVYDLVTLKNLSFRWEDSAELIHDLNMSIRPGRTIGLAAESGGGKTTLAYLLAGLMEPSSGDILWQGKKIRQSDLLKNVSYLFQFPERQIFSRTVFEEIAFGLKQQNLNRSQIDERVKNAMHTVSLPFDEFAERPPHLLSGGEMRKVALASSIVLDRPLRIYDEPTAELDSDAVRSLKDSLLGIQSSGGTQIIASHDVDFLFETCDDFVMLKDGHVRFAGDRENLYDQPEVFEECGLSVPGIVSLDEDEQLRKYVRDNRIVSVSQLITKLQQTT